MLRLFYKKSPSEQGGYLFSATADDYLLFLSGSYKPLPALSPDSARMFIASYNAFVGTLWDHNRHNTSFGFMPLALRNTWQSSFYQGAESYARLQCITEGDVYFTSPVWFLWASQHIAAEVMTADIKQARLDLPRLFFERVWMKYQGIRFALSHRRSAKDFGVETKFPFFTVWTKAGQRLWLDKSHEPFYGPLPGMLPGARIICHDEGANVIDKQSQGLPVVSDGACLRFVDWLALTMRIMLFRCSIPKNISCPRLAVYQDLSLSIKNQLALAWLSYYAGRNVARACPEAKFVSLYEGNCWEQGLLRAAKEAARPVIAIQHTAFSPSLLKINNDVPGKFLPDKILTSGPAAADMLLRLMGHSSVRIKAGCAVRRMPAAHAASDGLQNNVLVLLQGAPQDGLFLHILRQHLSARKVVVRCHPSQPIDDVHPFSKSILTLQQDLDQAAVVLYNGTTAVFEALESGVPAIYVSCGNALSQDPLFNLDCTIKRDCGESTNLENVIAALAALEPQQRAEGYRVARAYINDYFSEASPPALDQMLKDIQNV